MIDVDALFNRQINKNQVKEYLAAHELVESKAVVANLDASDQFKIDAQLFQEHLAMYGQFDKWMFDQQVDAEQQANAYCWMAIYTAKQEKQLGVDMIDDIDDYVNSIMRRGNYTFSNEQMHVINLMRYQRHLKSKVDNQKTIGSFYSVNLQFWFIYYGDLKKEAATHE